MIRHAWIAVVIIAVVWTVGPRACLADDETVESERASDTSPGVTTIDELLAATSYEEIRFAPTTLGNGKQPTDDRRIVLDLEDNGLLGRLRRNRSLSFVTFSDQGKTRIFLGVNADGFVGIHLTGKSKGRSSAFIENRLPPASPSVPLRDEEL